MKICPDTTRLPNSWKSYAIFAASLTGGLLPAIAEPDPAWWANGSPAPVSATGSQPLAVANVGQAKYMARRALEALSAIDPALADSIAKDLVGAGKPIPSWAVPSPGSPEALAQFSPLLIGQLKAIADPFYRQLHVAAPDWLADQREINQTQDPAVPSFIFPWTSQDTDNSNKAAATVGQLKAVFALRFEMDGDSDQLSDLWELANFGNTGASNSDDFDGDGVTNLDEYLAGTDPNSAGSTTISAQLAGGELHSMALASDGKVWSWGRDYFGQRGDGEGATTHKPAPIKTVSGMTRITSVSTGANSAAAINEDGKLWMWGNNGNGQLGNGNTTNQTSPVRVDISPVKLVACGLNHTIAMDLSGQLWAWGRNSNGAFGNGSQSSLPMKTPVRIAKPLGMGPVVQLAASDNSSYALDASGAIWAWGANSYGQLGIGSPNDSNVPVKLLLSDSLASLPAIVEISATSVHVVARGADGSLWSWGHNAWGTIGDGTTTSRTRPKAITAGTEGALPVAAGRYHSLSADDSGSFWSWGDNNRGQLGTNNYTDQPSPFHVTPSWTSGQILKLAGGYEHTLILRNNGEVWAGGFNSDGQLGDGTITTRLAPVKLLNFKLLLDDSDSDGLSDSWERYYFQNLNQNGLDDFMSGGVRNRQKYSLGLNPLSLDTDGDGMADAWEIVNGLDPLDPADAAFDPDGDGLTNLQESTSNTDPRNPYSIHEGVMDNIALQPGFDLSTSDLDADSLSHVQETAIGTNPLLSDTDGDGVTDGLDPFPLDPTRETGIGGTPGDVTPPLIVITAPEGAVEL